MIIKLPPYYGANDLDNYLQKDLYTWMHEVTTAIEDVPDDVINVALTFNEDTGNASAVANVINIVGGAGIATSGSGNTITISTNSSGFNWQQVTSVSPPNPIQAVVNNAYVCAGMSQVTFILPLAPSLGDSFIVVSATSAFLITQNGGQLIIVGTTSTTPGSGTLNSNSIGDTVEIIYIGSNTFLGLAYQGTLTAI